MLEKMSWPAVIIGFIVLAIWAVLGPLGCASQPRLGEVLNQAAALATGPCAKGIADTAAVCKQQYPNLPW